MIATRREWLIGSAGVALAAAVSRVTPAFGDGQEVVGGRAFGTYWRLTLPAAADKAATVEAINAIIDAVDRSMSPFASSSEITRFNLSRTTDWVAVSRPWCEVATESLRVARATGGAFDPTVGPIVGRFGFGPIHGSIAGRHADIEVRDGAVRKLNPVLTLDFCGIAKGYALDRIVAALDGLDLGEFLIELGGEVFGRGRRWRIGIENPLPGQPSIHRIVDLNNLSIATSGDRYESFEVGRRRYSHIVDPRALTPVDGNVASVSVLAPTAMEADAWATGLTVLGVERGAALAERLGVPALFLLRDGIGLSEVAVAGFDEYIVA